MSTGSSTNRYYYLSTPTGSFNYFNAPSYLISTGETRYAYANGFKYLNGRYVLFANGIDSKNYPLKVFCSNSISGPWTDCGADNYVDDCYAEDMIYQDGKYIICGRRHLSPSPTRVFYAENLTGEWKWVDLPKGDTNVITLRKILYANGHYFSVGDEYGSIHPYIYEAENLLGPWSNRELAAEREGISGIQFLNNKLFVFTSKGVFTKNMAEA